MQRKDDIEQSLVDAVIITNFNPEMLGDAKNNSVRLVAFDFSLNNNNAIKDFSSSALKNIKNLKDKPKTEETSLSPEFIKRFSYTSEANGGVDQEIVLTLPLESAI